MAGETLGEVLRRLGQSGGLQGDLAQTDAQLLERFARRRDEPAFAAMMARHGPMVLGLCRRLLPDARDAEDAFQAAFLVLARKAGALRRQTLLGAWLYGVAWRVAVRLRGRAALRHRRERAGVDLDALPADDAAWSDARWVVHEEVQRLPDAYRSAVILCCLDGKTTEEAARLLRRPVGTVKSRLNRGREILRMRLTRRGVTASVGAVGTALAATTATATAALVNATVRAAIPFATGAAASGLVSARAVALSQGVMRTMILTKVIVAAALLLAVVALGGVGSFAYRTLAAAAGDPKVDPPKSAAADAEGIQGTWTAVSAEQDGKEAPAEAIKDFTLIVTADKLTFNPTGENRQSSYKLDPSKTPKEIELTPLDGPAKGKPMKNIYRLDGDRLTLCLQNGDGAAPAEFATKADSGLRLLVLKRRPADKPKDDREAVQGTWVAVSGEAGGTKLTPSQLEAFLLVITPDQLVFGPNFFRDLRASYKLDPTKTPKEIELTSLDGAAKWKAMKDLYRMDGDRLTLCIQYDDRYPAPTEFATKPDSGLWLFHLKRWPRDDAPKDLTAEIVAPAEVASTDPELKGQFVLTNRGDVAVRICTLCNGNDGLGGPFGSHYRPDWWKSDSPPLEASAKSVLALEPGKSYSFPFTIRGVHFQDRDTFLITAFYSVSEEDFAKKLDLWRGQAEAAPVLVKVRRK